jgi:hypothetical protein
MDIGLRSAYNFRAACRTRLTNRGNEILAKEVQEKRFRPASTKESK